MVICKECGKKLGILEGYHHPTMGKNCHLCSLCFDQVSESVAKWGEFVLSNSFNMRTSENNSCINWKKLIPSFVKIWNTIENVWVKKEYL